MKTDGLLVSLTRTKPRMLSPESRLRRVSPPDSLEVPHLSAEPPPKHRHWGGRKVYHEQLIRCVTKHYSAKPL